MLIVKFYVTEVEITDLINKHILRIKVEMITKVAHNFH